MHSAYDDLQNTHNNTVSCDICKIFQPLFLCEWYSSYLYQWRHSISLYCTTQQFFDSEKKFTRLWIRLQSSQIGSEHDLHQCFAKIVRASRLQNKQYFTESFSGLTVIVHIHLFKGRLFAQFSLEIPLSGSLTCCLHTGQFMTLASYSSSRVIVLHIYLWRHTSQNVCKHCKYRGMFNLSRQIGQRNDSWSVWVLDISAISRNSKTQLTFEIIPWTFGNFRSPNTSTYQCPYLSYFKVLQCDSLWRYSSENNPIYGMETALYLFIYWYSYKEGLFWHTFL